MDREPFAAWFSPSSDIRPESVDELRQRLRADGCTCDPDFFHEGTDETGGIVLAIEHDRRCRRYLALRSDNN